MMNEKEDQKENRSTNDELHLKIRFI